MKMRWWFTWGAVCAAAFAVLLEIAMTMAGYADVPLHDANNRIGYIPRPSQAGAFMGRNDWVFNERSMGKAAAFAATAEKTDILLMGDSIVLGSFYPQSEKLGPQIEKMFDLEIWPVGAGSWSLLNEVHYLEDNPDVASAVDGILLVLNSRDFGAPASWASELTHPRSRPLSTLYYLAMRYIVNPAPPEPAPEFQVPERDPVVALADAASIYGKPVTIWLYPALAELPDAGKADFVLASLAERLKRQPALRCAGIRFVHDIPGWSASLYRDRIHPTVEGVSLLAAAIGDDIRKTVTGSNSPADPACAQ